MFYFLFIIFQKATTYLQKYIRIIDVREALLITHYIPSYTTLPWHFRFPDLLLQPTGNPLSLYSISPFSFPIRVFISFICFDFHTSFADNPAFSFWIWNSLPFLYAICISFDLLCYFYVRSISGLYIYCSDLFSVFGLFELMRGLLILGGWIFMLPIMNLILICFDSLLCASTVKC